MIFGIFKKEEKKADLLNNLYAKIKNFYDYDNVTHDRKVYLKELVEKYGYLPYPHIRALEELTPAEVLFALETKWEHEGVLKQGVFCFDNAKISPLARYEVTNSDWIKKEQHNIKLVNLAGLGDGNVTQEPGKFIDWLRQLLVLPTGIPQKGVMSTTIYLIPFHPREFGCAYLPTSYGTSENLEDKALKEKVGIDGEEQVKLFIELAQLAGHPVIYDVLPQTGRFSKLVLSNPHIARWFDIKELLAAVEADIERVAVELKKDNEEDDVEIVKTVIFNTLHSGAGDLGEEFKSLYEKFNAELLKNKKVFSNKMMTRQVQAGLAKRVKRIVSKVNGTSEKANLTEADIKCQGEIIQTLIKEGLWPAPGGAWCSAGIPVFDKMSECGGYPVFRHFNYKDEDVTEFANLDCQTPFYFVYLDEGRYNQPVIDFYVGFLKKLQERYNFDGFRVDHIDHVADEVSEQNGVPISYRAPQKVLAKVNSSMKEKIPYFACLAEYMLWDKLYAEYHQNMKFDILWGNDIIMQYEKTPEKIVEDNHELANYNTKNLNLPNLSVLKTYNNQDGEFRAIDQYPGQLGEKGALFKWFKLKFIPGGKNAQRPVMYIDGDESFTPTGIEGVIGAEVSMPRAKNEQFFNNFDAIRKFSLNNELTREGEAEIMLQEDDGFVVWLISKDLKKESLLVAANFNSPTETIKEDGGNVTIKQGLDVLDKRVELPCDYKIVSEIKLPEYGIEMWEAPFDCGCEASNVLSFDKLEPGDFRIYKLEK